MDCNKLEDLESTTNDENLYAEKATCQLEDSDSQCGHVFFNEITRLLKFYCTYCRETYDNIEYFCQHLSEHINDIDQDVYKQDAMGQLEEDVEEAEEIEYIADELEELEKTENENFTTNQAEDDESTRDAFESEQCLEKETINHDLTEQQMHEHDVNNGEMFIEEIEDADEIREEIEQEMLESLEEEEEEAKDNSMFLEDTSTTSTTNVDYEDHARLQVLTSPNTSTDCLKRGNSFEECFIKETNIDKIRSEGVCVLKEKHVKERQKPVGKRKSYLQDLSRLKRRRKKVTTVKVIAVKNRIAELYERIQNEQQKSQQIFSNEFLNNEHHEQETQDAIESLINGDDSQNNTSSTEESKTAEVTRKIIGETLITLIPEGTQIPTKLPSPVSKSCMKMNVFKDNLTTNSKSFTYNLKKPEENKEKLAVCPACGKTFRSHFSLTIHKRIHYLESDSSVKLAHKCSDCDELFNKLSQLKHHVETVHYPEGFICKICNRKLSSLSLLERHMVKVHLDRPFNCKHCNKNFSDPLTYEEHLASHNSGEVYKCSTCGRKYATEFFLMEHMRNHKEQMPQTCVVCGKVTLRITQHMKIHTPRPKRLLSCTVCGKVFNFSSGLSHHFKIMHKLPRPPPKPKKETANNAIKRKRRNRLSERCGQKKKSLNYSPPNTTDNAFILDSDKFPDQIIEEQIEIPHEVYDDATTTTPGMLNLETNKICIKEDEQMLDADLSLKQQEVLNHKEEEAKRVIVELIQNSSYTSFFPDNLSSVLEVTPPIAREETISAVNSIVHDC